MRARGKARVTAKLSCAAAVLLVPCAAVAQQAPPPAELDPNAPLDPMPDLGVEWPDMNVDPVQATAEEKAAAVDPAVERRYSLAVEGVSGVDDNRREAARIQG